MSPRSSAPSTLVASSLFPSSVVTISSQIASSTPTATIIPEIITPSGSRYQEYGCYEDVNGTGYPLVAPYNDGTVTTVNQCINDCARIDGYYYAAIEGSTCYCSDDIYRAVQTPGQCDTPCSGDPTQSCGGMRKRDGGHIIVYRESLCYACDF